MAASGSFANRSVVYALLRVTLAINIAMRGFTRLWAGQSSFAEHLMKQFAPTPLPEVHGGAAWQPDD